MTDDAASLYELPLDEFTAARDALAARLKRDGDAGAAAEVKKLRKPTVAAWAVNQLARRDAGRVGELLDVRARIASARGADELRALTERRRALVAALVDAARQVLDDAGHGAAPATLDDVARTLQAGGTEEERDALRAGVLTRPLDPSGFEGLGAFEGFGAVDASQPEASAPEPSRADERARTRADELDARARAAEEEAAEQERAAAAAEREARKLAQRAATARRAADRARTRAEEARAALEE
ncbi:MAG TPA: hypothetical protein VHJ34_11370 [Actinomycetota bacterium]|nr:hypothetical protein [Actinomycetota bacterium]